MPTTTEKHPKTRSGGTPQRLLGRIDDEVWRTLKQAAMRAGLPFSDWALEILLAATEQDDIWPEYHSPPGSQPRQIGRVPDADWELIKLAAAARKLSFTGWAVGVLLAHAKPRGKMLAGIKERLETFKGAKAHGQGSRDSVGVRPVAE